MRLETYWWRKLEAKLTQAACNLNAHEKSILCEQSAHRNFFARVFASGETHSRCDYAEIGCGKSNLSSWQQACHSFPAAVLDISKKGVSKWLFNGHNCGAFADRINLKPRTRRILWRHVICDYKNWKVSHEQPRLRQPIQGKGGDVR